MQRPPRTSSIASSEKPLRARYGLSRLAPRLAQSRVAGRARARATRSPLRSPPPRCRAPQGRGGAQVQRHGSRAPGRGKRANRWSSTAPASVSRPIQLSARARGATLARSRGIVRALRPRDRSSGARGPPAALASSRLSSHRTPAGALPVRARPRRRPQHAVRPRRATCATDLSVEHDLDASARTQRRARGRLAQAFDGSLGLLLARGPVLSGHEWEPTAQRRAQPSPSSALIRSRSSRAAWDARAGRQRRSGAPAPSRLRRS